MSRSTQSKSDAKPVVHHGLFLFFMNINIPAEPETEIGEPEHANHGIEYKQTAPFKPQSTLIIQAHSPFSTHIHDTQHSNSYE